MFYPGIGINPLIIERLQLPQSIRHFLAECDKVFLKTGFDHVGDEMVHDGAVGVADTVGAFFWNVRPFDQIQPDKITKSKLYGLDLLKRTPLTDSSWRFHTTRFRRSLQELHADNLVLKRPSVFNKLTLITRVKTGMDPASASPLITNSEPSTFYQVPPPSPSGPESSASNIQLPPENAGTSFYESNQDDVSLHPSLVIQELQQQVISNLY